MDFNIASIRPTVGDDGAESGETWTPTASTPWTQYANLPHTRSVLMDIDTARDHDALAVEEPNPSRFTPARLTSEEADALDYLRSHSSTGCLRIEQERIVFDYAVERLRDAVAGTRGASSI